MAESILEPFHQLRDGRGLIPGGLVIRVQFKRGVCHGVSLSCCGVRAARPPYEIRAGCGNIACPGLCQNRVPIIIR
ncbi:hypothetical protein GCM10007426_41640 [Alloalcanivorax dieselolei]|nr:hypothetical protein GCM10007426_41640 [Alloalcanivorax dieselolei]